MSDALDDDLPALLILGEGEPLLPGIQDALGRHATFVDAANADSPMAAVLASAPDLVVLVGDAAERAEEILASLGAHPLARVVPVAVLLEANDLAARLQAVRSGVAVVDRSASVDALAREIAELVRTFSERESTVTGELGEATLGDVLDIVRRELEDGILTVGQRGGEQARFLLRRGRHVDDAIREFVTKIRPMLDEAQPLYFDYDNAGDRLELLDESTEEGNRDVFQGRRVVLIEDDAALADALAQELRAHQAEVVVLASTGSGIMRARALDPEIVLIDEKGLDGPAYEVLRQIRQDPRLRWASLLVIRGAELMPPGQAPRMDRLAGAFLPLLAADVDIKKRAKTEPRFDTRLEALGPSRLLRALVSTGHTFLVTVRHARVSVDVAVAQGLIAGASALSADADTPIEGLPALAALLAISSGRVSVERRQAPASANILMMLGDALDGAARESPPIRPSIFPAAMAQSPSTPPARLIEELETILGRLRRESIPTDISREAKRPSIVPTLLTGARGRTQNGSVPPGPETGSVEPLLATPTHGRQRRPSPTDTAKTPLRPGPLSTPARDPKRAARQAFAPKRRRAPAHRTLVGHALSPAKLPAEAKVPAPKTPNDAGQRLTPVVSLPPTPSIPVVPPAPPPPILNPREISKNRPPPPMLAPVRRAPKALVKTVVKRGVDAAADPVVVQSVPSSAAEKPETTAQSDVADVLFSDADMVETSESSPFAAVAQSSIDPTPAPVLSAGVPEEIVYPKRRSWVPVAIVLLLLVAAVGLFVAYQSTPDEVGVATGEPAVVPSVPATPSTTPSTPPTTPSTTPSTTRATPEPVTGADVPTEIPSPSPDEPSPSGDGPAQAEPPETTAEVAPEPVETQPSGSEEAELETAGPNSDIDGPGENATRAEQVRWNLQSGNFHRNRGHLRTARQRYDRVLRLSRNNGRALAGLTRLALAEHNANEAVRYAQRLVRANGNNAGNHVLLGDAHAAAGQRARATSEWQRAIQINPNHRTAQRRLR